MVNTLGASNENWHDKKSLFTKAEQSNAPAEHVEANL